MLKSSIVFASLLLMGYSCNRTVNTPDRKEHNTEDLIEMNSQVLQYEDSLISDYISNNGMEMETSRTGLRMRWNKRAEKGNMPVSGSEVTVVYSMLLLDSTIAQTETTLDFKVDYSDVTNGLNEAVKKMKPNEEVFLIVPSHLGYGVHGNGNKVPSRATLFYNLKLVEIKS